MNYVKEAFIILKEFLIFKKLLILTNTIKMTKIFKKFNLMFNKNKICLLHFLY